MFSLQNEVVIGAVNDIPWYMCKQATKKLSLQFLILLQKPLELKCFGLFKLSFNFFAKLLRVMYSILNVLLATLMNK